MGALHRTGRLVTDQLPTLLAAVGDAADPGTFSGIPYHCLQAGAEANVFDGGLRLDTNASFWRRKRIAWNLSQIFRVGKPGGYQYSDRFLSALWKQAELPEYANLINFFPLYPNDLVRRKNFRRWLYIDQTLHQLFAYYGFERRLPATVILDAISRERDQYQSAAGILCHSRWAAEDVLKHYDLPADRIHVVLCGANLDRRALREWEPEDKVRRERNRDIDILRLVFVGKEWKRKGLDRLLRAMTLANGRGAKIELLVIGTNPDDLPSDLRRLPGVEWAGFVDKRREPRKFIDMVAACDVGCLLSLAEAGGMSLREFSRLGLPTIAPLTGGSPEQVVEGATHLVAPDVSDAEIADILVQLAKNPALLARQKDIAWRERKAADWDHSIAQIGDIIGRPVRQAAAV